ncbi:MAG: glycosyltransferase [Chloroflexi bacterium]|nr:MAG: glycosyltransferase [Chloroflexota bacterium]
MDISSVICQQQTGIIIFLAALGVITLGNLLTMRRLISARLYKEPRVSVMVPARNEERNIERCVRSLLNQSYNNYELLVLNDDSQDRTGEILARLAEEDERLRVLEGTFLPEGWGGKNWACWRLATEAKGEYFLFTDADTWHHPDMLHDVVAAAHFNKADLLSGFPKQEMETPAEKLVLPVLGFAFSVLSPFFLSSSLALAWLVPAVGQFLLFHRDAYTAIGGHAAVRNSLVEDIALGRRIIKMRYRLVFAPISDRVYCRMYRTNQEVLNGLSRTLLPVFNFNLPLYLFAWGWMLYVFWQPLVVLGLFLSGIELSFSSGVYAFLSILVSLILWVVPTIVHRFLWYTPLFYPLVILLSFLTASRSAYLHLTRRSTVWKGRRVEHNPKQVLKEQ